MGKIKLLSLGLLAVLANGATAFDINAKRAFVCDLDGTLFVGAEPIRQAVDFVIANTKSGRFRFYYLTNNTSKTPQEFLKKLVDAGIPVESDQVLTPLMTLESYIRQKGYRSVYLLASGKVTDHLTERLRDVGTAFEYSPERNDLVALTFDRELTYDKLARAARLWNMRNGGNARTGLRTARRGDAIDYVMTHPDGFCPSEEGPVPDIGGMAKMLEATNGMKPTQVFGKPSPTLLAPVLAQFKPEEIAVVGDRLYTDKAIADNAGVDFVCVLSGETTSETLGGYEGTPPAIVVETFDGVDRFPTRGIVAHRGDAAEFPEDTIPAFDSAVAKGAEMVELDEWRCKSGELIVMHDPKVDRTTNGTGKISDLTLDEIRRLDAGVRKGAGFAGTKVPTLVEAIERFPHTGLLLNIHCKTGSAAPEVAELLRKTGRLSQGILMMDSRADLVVLKSKCPWVKTGLVMNTDAGWEKPWTEDEAERKLRDAADLGVDFVQILPNSHCTREQLRYLHDRGIRTTYFVANTGKTMREIVDEGHDFIFTDHYSELRPIYEGRNAVRAFRP